MTIFANEFSVDLCLCLVTIVLSLYTSLYLWYQYNFSYWKSKSVPGPQPSFPFGNIKQTSLGKSNFGEECGKIYEEWKQHPFVGVYFLFNKALIVNDLDLIKTVLVKDFSYFSDHGLEFDVKVNPLIAALFHLKGNQWKRLRTQMTPIFTSSQTRRMFQTISTCGMEMGKYLDKVAAIGGAIDAKDIMSKFASDVIISTGFGVDSNSFISDCPFVEYSRVGRLIFEPTLKQKIIQTCSFFVPSLVKGLRGRMLSKEITDFFFENIKRTVKFREENNLERKDLMQLLIRLKNNQSIESLDDGDDTKAKDKGPTLTLDELCAQAFGFYIAAYETTSSTLTYLLYHVARNPMVQERLHRELDQVFEEHPGEVRYESMMKLTYMMQVINEGLRLNPVFPTMFRLCTKRYVIPGTDVVIEKGTPVIIPVLGIQRDPAFYPNPEKFDPDRFSAENLSARRPYSFLTFGEGPRVCIGLRVAMIEMRIALIAILRSYKVSPADDKPLQISNKTFLMIPNDVNLKIEKRF